MTAAVWVAVALLVVCVVQWFVIAWALERAEKAERHLRWLNHQADELRADYGAEIGRSKRMARVAIERMS